MFKIHLLSTDSSYPLPYPCPTLFNLHPPNWSMISDGHSIALNLSLKLCLNPWITYGFDSFSFIHLLRAALALFALHISLVVYLGKAYILSLLCSKILSQAQSDAPTSGIHLSDFL